MSIISKINYLNGTKTAIKNAIKAKGVAVSDSDTFRSYASKIGQIQGGGSGGSSKAEYEFYQHQGEVSFPREPYSVSNNFTYTSFADYRNSDKDFCCTQSNFDGYSGDAGKVFDGDVSTISNQSFFFKFSKKMRIKKIHIVINSVLSGNAPVILGTNDVTYATTFDMGYWTELHDFQGQSGEFTVDISNAEYQYFFCYMGQANVSILEIIAEDVVIGMKLKSANMTPSIKVFPNDYMRITTQDWYNGEETIPSQELICKPTAIGGCLVDYVDTGADVDLKLFYAKSDNTVIPAPWVQPALTSNGVFGGNEFAVKADSELDSARPAWKAFDGNTVMSNPNIDQFSSSFGQPHWLAFSNPNPLTVTKITVFNGADNCLPLDWQFECSDNGEDWSQLTSGTNINLTSNGEWSFDVPSSGLHKYYRFKTTSGYGTDSNVLGITEIKITATEDAIKEDTYFASPFDITPPAGYESVTKVAELSIPEHTTKVE